MSAAEKLIGLELDGGWVVEARLSLPQGHTGGHFSYGYRVLGPDGTPAFLKAIDFSAAINASDPAVALQSLTEAFNHERALLAECRDRRADRVIRILDDGQVSVPGEVPPIVQYLIFEMADGDVRSQMIHTADFDCAWALRSLHHVATGLKQLHMMRVAHQDLKPSNVLVFDGIVSKVGDVGRSSHPDRRVKHDTFTIAGARPYAPPELRYNHINPDWNARRFACDMYLLGSMVASFFTGLSMSSLIFNELQDSMHPGVGKWGGSYEEVLPYVRDAYGKALDKFAQEVPEPIREDLTQIVRELCDPDPAFRGYPALRGAPNPYDLERYVTRFDLMARRAEIKVTGGVNSHA
ncbi:MAG: protein kinase [Chlorobi bacterium]|nr:protein kinase [Chlorobiota bacterium]